MAEELVFSQRCTEALELLKPIVNQYRKESWSILLKAALKLALKCAYLVAAVPEYVAYALELSSNDIIEDDEEKCRVFSNVCRLLETPAKIPSAEPGIYIMFMFNMLINSLNILKSSNVLQLTTFFL